MANKLKKVTKKVVNLSVLPGEPLNGSGRISIHLFVPDTKGPMIEPCALRVGIGKEGQNVTSGATRGRLACNVVPDKHTHNNTIKVTARTDDPRAVSCPKCIASDIYKIMMDRINQES